MRDLGHGVLVDAGDALLHGDLAVPPAVAGLVLFVHGSGSSRRSPRNRQVAATLQSAGLATLLFDLLTEEEEVVDRVTREHRFDIDLLARRTIAAVDWIAADPAVGTLPLGLFGASTGAAAALIGAAERPDRVSAVVSRGGRPDLAGDALDRVRAATLLVVGGADPAVRDLNERAGARLGSVGRLVVVPGATHLFEEPGALESVSRLAADWFLAHASRPRAGSRPAAG